MEFTQQPGSLSAATQANIISLTEQLISLPSVSGNEAAILQCVADWLTDANCDQVLQQDTWTAGVVRASTRKATRAVILCGHIDTVPPGDEAAWRRSPWEAYQSDGRLYGLGSTDMKAGVALQMVAAREYANARRDNLDVWCVAVAHEEVDGAGSADFTRYFAAHTAYDEVSCMIAEPTDGKIEIGHRGNHFIELVFAGDAGHASQEAAYERSALPRVVNFLHDLPTVRRELHAQFTDPLMGRPSFTPTRISPDGSFASNKTSGASLIAVDVRTTPALDAAFEPWLDQLAERYGCTWRYAAAFVASARCQDDAAILHIMRNLLPDAPIAVSAGATDQAFFQEIGAQTVVYGPGDFDQAHAVDESVSIKQIAATYDVYWRALQRL